jgi:hypothetical protein
MSALGTVGLVWLVLACSGCSRTGLSIEGVGAQTGDGARAPGGRAGTESDGCREITIEEEVAVVEVPGTVLLVFDRSGSMIQPWDTTPRWQVAGGAIAEALRGASPALTVGAIFFPSPDGTEMCVDPSGIACMFVPGLVLAGASCFVAPTDSPDHIAFAPAPQFLDAFEASATPGGEPRYAPLGGGLTPLREALSAAADALHAGTRPGVTSVVVVTDGEPNCDWDATAATEALDGLREIGIDTYVLGLPGVGPDAMVLAELATHGGTGEFLTPAGSDTLERHFRDIIEDTASVGLESCTVPLDPALSDLRDVRLLIGDRAEARELAPIDTRGERAWSLSPDGSTLHLHGATCTEALAGSLDRVRLAVGCAGARPR